MDEVLRVVTLGRAARNLCNCKNRQPLQRLYTDADEDLGGCIRISSGRELNVKELVFLSDMSELPPIPSSLS